MQKIIFPRKHFRIAIVAAWTSLTAQSSALALSSFDLPICPSVGDKKDSQTADEKLPAIKLDESDAPNSSTAKPLVDGNESPSSEQRSSSPLETKKPNSGTSISAGAGATGKSASKSIKHSAPNVYQNAQNANCLPLSLMPSRNEAEESHKLSLDAQRAQMAALWTSTIERSDDIQFVVKVLQPQSDQKHAVAKALNLVGAAMYNLGSATAPSVTRPALGLIGAPNLDNLFKTNDKHPEISVGETIFLYKMVRDIAENLVETYRNYRRVISERDSAQLDLADLQKLSNSFGTDNQAAFMQYEYTLKKAQRDALLSDERAELYRQKLAELAGFEAVDKLDEQIKSERSALANIIGRPDINPAIAAPTEESAAVPRQEQRR